MRHGLSSWLSFRDTASTLISDLYAESALVCSKLVHRWTVQHRLCGFRQLSLQVIDEASIAGSALPNEDVAGHGDGTAWVLDGATGLSAERLLPGHSDAAWLASTYSQLLSKYRWSEGAELRRALESVIRKVSQRFEIEKQRPLKYPYELPSASGALARVCGNSLEFACLGDCRVIVRVQEGGEPTFVTSQERAVVSSLDARVIRRLMKLLEDGAMSSYSEALRSSVVLEELRANRSLMNSPAGYWIFGLDPEAARHMEVKKLYLSGGTAEGLLASDGLYRLVDTFAAYPDGKALLEAARSKGMSTLLGELRSLEDADPECRVHPRLKRSDDATGLLFTAMPG
jgi:serine/threonine protein phosphatase PrpC